jgi:TrmH family RNA methyltransferase
MITRSELKYIQSLAHKKFREAEGCFIVEGVKMVSELIHTYPELVLKIFAVQSWLDQNSKNLPNNIICHEVTDDELSKLSFLTTAQLVLCLSKMPIFEKKKNHKVTLLLDQIQDPGNLGTIIRTCDWFGIDTVICSMDTADVFSPKVVQSSMGSVLRVNVQYLSLDVFLDQHTKCEIFAATLDGDDVQKVTFETPSILIIGNESKGVSPSILKRATKKISIPRMGHAESLNAAVATGILLSKMIR